MLLSKLNEIWKHLAGGFIVWAAQDMIDSVNKLISPNLGEIPNGAASSLLKTSEHDAIFFASHVPCDWH